MKTINAVVIFASMAILCSCNQKSAPKMIAPLPTNVSVENLQDCTIPAAFTLDDFNWMGGNLSMEVYSKDLYDAVEVSQMQIGDTVLFESKPLVVTTIEEKDYGIEINGGLEEGGCLLVGYEGGTYIAEIFDTHSTYTHLGKAQVPLAEDFIIVDCGMDYTDPLDTIRTDQKLYIENLKGGRNDFHPLNTLVTIENGVITEINRRWIP